jgi:hypothetical protein
LERFALAEQLFGALEPGCDQERAFMGDSVTVCGCLSRIATG